MNGPITFARKGDATLWLDSERRRIEEGTWGSPAASSRLLEDFATEWLRHRTGKGGQPLAIRTRQLYADLLRLHIVGDDGNRRMPPPTPRLGRMPLSAIKPADVRHWHTDRLTHSGTTQVRQSYALLRAILNTAVDDGLLPAGRNPCRIRGAGAARTPERALLSWSDVQALSDSIEPYLRVAVLLTFDAHLRRGELLAVQRRDVDVQGRRLHVRRQVVHVRDESGRMVLVEVPPKADSVRTVDLTGWCTDLLDQHLAASAPARQTDRLFLRPDGRELHPHHLEVAWRAARTTQGLDWAHFHDLRAAGLTLIAQLGATLKETQARAGHSTVAAAMVYQRNASARGRVLADLLSEYASRQLVLGAGDTGGAGVALGPSDLIDDAGPETRVHEAHDLVRR